MERLTTSRHKYHTILHKYREALSTIRTPQQQHTHNHLKAITTLEHHHPKTTNSYNNATTS